MLDYWQTSFRSIYRDWPNTHLGSQNKSEEYVNIIKEQLQACRNSATPIVRVVLPRLAQNGDIEWLCTAWGQDQSR